MRPRRALSARDAAARRRGRRKRECRGYFEVVVQNNIISNPDTHVSPPKISSNRLCCKTTKMWWLYKGEHPEMTLLGNCSTRERMVFGTPAGRRDRTVYGGDWQVQRVHCNSDLCELRGTQGIPQPAVPARAAANAHAND